MWSIQLRVAGAAHSGHRAARLHVHIRHLKASSRSCKSNPCQRPDFRQGQMCHPCQDQGEIFQINLFAPKRCIEAATSDRYALGMAVQQHCTVCNRHAKSGGFNRPLTPITTSTAPSSVATIRLYWPTARLARTLKTALDISLDIFNWRSARR